MTESFFKSKVSCNILCLKIFCFIIFLLTIQKIGLAQSILPQKYLIDFVKKDTSTNGWIEFISEHAIRKVWIDSIEICVGLNMIIEVEAGFHNIQVRCQNPENWFLKDVIESIEVIANDTLQFILSFPEFKMLNSDPYGADIYVNNVYIGKTPYLVSKEVLAESQITLSKFGFKDTTLSQADHYLPSIWTTVEPDQSVQEKAYQKIQLKYAQKKRQRNYALLTFGLSLASGAVAYLTKKEADQNYNHYLVSGNPNDMNRLYDLTKRYDRFAAGSYIIFEVNMLASAYFFFRYLLNR